MTASNNLSDVIKDYYECPITHDIMLDPVAADPCGHIFERAAIQKCMEQNPKCPFDQKLIVQLNPKVALRNEIHAVIDQYPLLFDNKTAQEMESEVNESYNNIHVNRPGLRPELNHPVLNPQDERRFERLRQNAANIRARTIQLPGFGPRGQLVKYREFTGAPIDQFVRDHFQGNGPHLNGQHFALRIAIDGSSMGIDFYQTIAEQC